jgi:DNA-binding NarL/FixJ family response regulator
MAAALLIGNANEPEFAGALAALREAFEVTSQRDITSALEAPPETVSDVELPNYEVIVLAQSRPGGIAAADLERLRRRFPLAAVIALVGSWCEGETRSGKPLSTACRLYWHQAADRFKQDLLRRQRGRPASWNLPATSTEEERALSRAAAPIRRSPSNVRRRGDQSSRGAIALFGHERSSLELLVDVCRAGGYDPIWMGAQRASEPRDVSAVIWDLSNWGHSADQELQQITRIVPAERVVALLGFPRWQDIQRAAQRGIGAVVSKPFVLDDLYSSLERVASTITNSAAR